MKIQKGSDGFLEVLGLDEPLTIHGRGGGFQVTLEQGTIRLRVLYGTCRFFAEGPSRPQQQELPFSREWESI